MNTRSRAVLTLAIAGLWACGKAGPPLPPLRLEPERPSDVALSQQGDDVALSFTAPRQSIDELRLPVLDVVIAWTADKQVDLEKGGERIALQVAPGEVIRTHLTPTPPLGSNVRATVRASARGRTSPTAGPVSLVVAKSPAPPEGLTATLDLAGPRISWEPLALAPTAGTAPAAAATGQGPAVTAPVSPGAPAAAPQASSTASGTPGGASSRLPVGVHVYARDRELETWERITTEPVTTASFVHQGGAERPTCYAARVVLRVSPLIEGSLSSESCVEERASAPLSPPTGLRAVAGESDVSLSWSPPTDARVARVRVLRRAGEGEPEVVAEVEAVVTVLRDGTPPRGVPLAYQLVGLDDQGRESPPSPADVVELRGEL